MKTLMREARTHLRGRPVLTVLAGVYVAIPLVIVFLLATSVIQGAEIDRETKNNCQRTAALATFIRQTVGKNPNSRVDAIANLIKLEKTLTSIGSCPP